MTRRNLRNVAGFNHDENSPELEKKINDFVINLKMSDFIALCNILNLDYAGDNVTLATRICFLLNKLKDSGDAQNYYG